MTLETFLALIGAFAIVFGLALLGWRWLDRHRGR